MIAQDLDLYDESRTLLFGGQLARRYKAEVGYNWADLYVALLDNYCECYLVMVSILQVTSSTNIYSAASQA